MTGLASGAAHISFTVARVWLIASTIGFLETPTVAAVQAFLDWQKSIHAPLGRSFTQRTLSGGLDPALSALLPLTSVHALRYLFLPTASPWTAFIDNGHQGTDAFSVMSSLAMRIGCRGLRVTAIPDSIEGEQRDARGRYGALALEVYGPEKTDFLNCLRSVALVHDGARWEFHQGGTPFRFEQLERYSARRKTDRFTFDMLETYLAELGLSPFEERFYLPDPGNAAMLVERQGPRPDGMEEFTLAEARARY